MRIIDAHLAQQIADKELFTDDAGVVQFVLSHTPTIDPAVLHDISRKELRVEIEKENPNENWYHKKFFCPECNLLIREEVWDERRMFGSSSVLKNNAIPKFCPDCGVCI